MKSSIQFIFNNSELGAGTRGASLGANAILVAARSKSSLLFKIAVSKQLKILMSFWIEKIHFHLQNTLMECSMFSRSHQRK